MSRAIQCLVLTPVGPRSNLDYVEDTVESFLHYMEHAESAMLLLDDSGSNRCSPRFEEHENVHCLSTDRLARESSHNTFGALFAKQAAALDAITSEYDWRCLLRLDDDALIIGSSPYSEALIEFERRPKIGMLGAYLRRGDGTDKQQAMAEQGTRIKRQILSRSALRHPRMALLLARVALKARLRGYRLGDMCTGGAFFLSRAAFEGAAGIWRQQAPLLSPSFLTDDLLISMYVAAAGYGFADFPTLAVNWRGLPMPVEDLVQRGKKVVHPVKDLHEPDHEKEVRTFFRERRRAEAAS